MRRHEPLHNHGPLRIYDVQYSRKTRRIPDWLCFCGLAGDFIREKGLLSPSPTPEEEERWDLLIDFGEWLEQKFRTCGAREGKA